MPVSTRVINDAQQSWQPGLAATLANSFERNHVARLTKEYSTATWLNLSKDQGGAASPIGRFPGKFELLRGAARERYNKLGLALTETLPNAADSAHFEQAVRLLNIEGRLLEAVRVLVRRVHTLVPIGPGFDTSHSDPDVPFSIFVSIPAGEDHATVRLAESILHETMHLQLSLFEAREPLVRPSTEEAYSPWQNTLRPIGGLVHGLFVFRVIFDWLDAVGKLGENRKDIRAYVTRRRREIVQEIDSLGDLSASTALTPAGVCAVNGWLDFSGRW